MKINTSNVNFTSRPQIVNDARKVMHLLTTEFPAVSGTQVSEFKCAQGNQQFQNLAARINSRIQNLIRAPFWDEFMKSPAGNYYNTLVTGIKKYSIANCSDFAKVWNLLSKLNGIQSNPAEIYLVRPDDAIVGRIDHAIHFINLGKMEFPKCDKLSKLKDILIVDPWLGLVDYAPVADLKFKYDFARFFKIPDGYNIMLNPYTNKEPDVTENIFNFFKNNFPQFFIKK